MKTEQLILSFLVIFSLEKDTQVESSEKSKLSLSKFIHYFGLIHPETCLPGYQKKNESFILEPANKCEALEVTAMNCFASCYLLESGLIENSNVRDDGKDIDVYDSENPIPRKRRQIATNNIDTGSENTTSNDEKGFIGGTDMEDNFKDIEFRDETHRVDDFLHLNDTEIDDYDLPEFGAYNGTNDEPINFPGRENGKPGDKNASRSKIRKPIRKGSSGKGKPEDKDESRSEKSKSEAIDSPKKGKPVDKDSPGKGSPDEKDALSAKGKPEGKGRSGMRQGKKKRKHDKDDSKKDHPRKKDGKGKKDKKPKGQKGKGKDKNQDKDDKNGKDKGTSPVISNSQDNKEKNKGQGDKNEKNDSKKPDTDSDSESDSSESDEDDNEPNKIPGDESNKGTNAANDITPTGNKFAKLIRSKLNQQLQNVFSNDEDGKKSKLYIRAGFIKCSKQFSQPLPSDYFGDCSAVQELLDCYVDVLMCENGKP